LADSDELLSTLEQKVLPAHAALLVVAVARLACSLSSFKRFMIRNICRRRCASAIYVLAAECRAA